MSFDRAWDVALRLAWEAFRVGTTPVGAVVVDSNGIVVASGRGRRYEQSGPVGQLAGSHVAHAEINALAQLDVSRHWEDHELLTTLEPCAMCHGAAIQSTLGALLYAGLDAYGGAARLDLSTPQSRRRPLRVDGPLCDARGALAVLMHLAWLMDRPIAEDQREHAAVAAHRATVPRFTEYAVHAKPELDRAVREDNYPAALRLATLAPIFG